LNFFNPGIFRRLWILHFSFYFSSSSSLRDLTAEQLIVLEWLEKTGNI